MKQIHASDLIDSIEKILDGISCLSLDCFDTIYWRNFASPVDIFFELEKNVLFSQYGIKAIHRINFEKKARFKRYINTGSTEVNLFEIYKEGLAFLNDNEIINLIQSEIKTEIKYGYLFRPVIELIKAAKQKGIKVIIVSDTYLKSEELLQLIRSKESNIDILIDDVYTSCENLKSKADGIWEYILADINIPAGEIVHIGDNYQSDYISASSFGINAIHLIQHSDTLEQILDARVNAGLQLIPNLRFKHGMPSPNHGILSEIKSDAKSLHSIGFMSIGPIISGFANFINNKINQFSNENKEYKVAFLMRDGYLPLLCLKSILPNSELCSLNISRFTAIAASFYSGSDILDFIKDGVNAGSIDSLLKQILLNTEEVKYFQEFSGRSSDNIFSSLIKFISTNEIQANIIHRSYEIRKKLILHVLKETGVSDGHTLVLIDLGYNGTIQNKLNVILGKELNVTSYGIYLISNNNNLNNIDRVGLIDQRNYDQRAIESVTKYVATLEMMCTNESGSVVDYQEDGTPLLLKCSYSKSQIERIKVIQDGCVDFVKKFNSTNCEENNYEEEYISSSVLSDLSRLLYFPLRHELLALSEFQFDVNLGSETSLELINFSKCEDDLRRLGIAYTGIGAQSGINKNLRMSHSLEIRKFDLTLSNYLLNYNRYGLNFKLKDFSYNSFGLKLLLVNESSQKIIDLEAFKTFDGYYMCIIPVLHNENMGLSFGKFSGFVQIQEIILWDPNSMSVGAELIEGIDFKYEGIEKIGSNIIKIDNNAYIFIRSAKIYINNSIMMTFRIL
jgi:FMN phosphatase YigB (HAD superfamily)